MSQGKVGLAFELAAYEGDTPENMFDTTSDGPRRSEFPYHSVDTRRHAEGQITYCVYKSGDRRGVDTTGRWFRRICKPLAVQIHPIQRDLPTPNNVSFGNPTDEEKLTVDRPRWLQTSADSIHRPWAGTIAQAPRLKTSYLHQLVTSRY